MSKSMDQGQAQHFNELDLDPNCSQRLGKELTEVLCF